MLSSGSCSTLLAPTAEFAYRLFHFLGGFVAHLGTRRHSHCNIAANLGVPGSPGQHVQAPGG